MTPPSRELARHWSGVTATGRRWQTAKHSYPPIVGPNECPACLRHRPTKATYGPWRRNRRTGTWSRLCTNGACPGRQVYVPVGELREGQ